MNKEKREGSGRILRGGRILSGLLLRLRGCDQVLRAQEGADLRIVGNVILSRQTRIRVVEGDIINFLVGADMVLMFMDDRAKDADLSELVYSFRLGQVFIQNAVQ